MNIGLHHFRLVETAVKAGTLTNAAESLHLTQSALSHQLKELERELNTPVFTRKGKRLQLTEEGGRFLESAEKILSEVRLLEKDIVNFKKGKIGTLNITTQCYTAYHWLPCIIKYYKAKCPDININIHSNATHKPLEFLLSGDLDVGIVKTKIDNQNIHYERIFEDQLMVIMSKEHPLAQKKQIEIRDFEDEELFLSFVDPNSGTVPVIERMIQMQQVKLKNLHRIHYTDAIIEMVSSNLGVSVLANWIIKPYLQSRNIVARPLPREVAKRTWYAATCKHNIAIQNFLDCLKYHFSEIVLDLDDMPEEHEEELVLM